MRGERLKEARKAAGYTQQKIAEMLGITQAAYSYIELGDKNPSLPVAKRLAVILHVSLDYLLGIKDTK